MSRGVDGEAAWEARRDPDTCSRVGWRLEVGREPLRKYRILRTPYILFIPRGFISAGIQLYKVQSTEYNHSLLRTYPHMYGRALAWLRPPVCICASVPGLKAEGPRPCTDRVRTEYVLRSGMYGVVLRSAA